MDKNKCTKCGHTWIPRSTKRTLECPQCRNPKWWAKRDKKGGIVRVNGEIVDATK